MHSLQMSWPTALLAPLQQLAKRRGVSVAALLADFAAMAWFDGCLHRKLGQGAENPSAARRRCAGSLKTKSAKRRPASEGAVSTVKP